MHVASLLLVSTLHACNKQPEKNSHKSGHCLSSKFKKILVQTRAGICRIALQLMHLAWLLLMLLSLFGLILLVLLMPGKVLLLWLLLVQLLRQLLRHVVWVPMMRHWILSLKGLLLNR